MKEKKAVGEYRSYFSSTIDRSGVWFYELFGWHYVGTTSKEERYVEKATYLVSEGTNRLRVESGYRSAGSGYNLEHIFERETDDPKYAKYCELEKRNPLGLWDGYPAVLERIKNAFPKGRPITYAQYKKRFGKFYVIGAVLLALLAFFVAMGPEKLGAPTDYSFPAALALFGCSSAAFIICGIAGHMKSLNKEKMAAEYQAYLAKVIPGANMRRIVQEASELQDKN